MEANGQILERVSKLIEKGQQVFAAGSYSDFTKSNILQWGPSVGWYSQTQTFLEDLLGAGHAYTRTFAEGNRDPSSGTYLEAALAILDSVKQDIEDGYMQSYRQLVEADLLGGLMGQAEYLLEKNYLVPAAAVAGAALQQGLEELIKRHDLKLKSREDLNSLGDKLLQAEILNGIERKQLSLMAGVRNSADHGKTEELTKDNVGSFVRDAVNFLDKHAT